MAEATDVPEEIEEETPTAKLGLVQIGMIIGIVIVTQVAMKFVLDAVFPPQYADAAAEEQVEEEVEEEPARDLGPPNYLPLDPALVVNVGSRQASQYLQTTIQLMTRDTEVYEAAKLHAPAIRSALILLFGEVDPDSLHNLEGKQKLQEDARVKTDEVLMELAGVKGVDKIYLTSLVFQ